MSAEKQAKTSTEEIVLDRSILDEVIASTRQTERPRAEELIRALTDEALKGTVVWNKNVGKTIAAGMKSIDEAISKQLAAIMHHADFQKMESVRARVDTVDGTPPMIAELVRLARHEDAKSENYWKRWTADYDYLYVLFVDQNFENPDPEHLTTLFTGERFVLYRIDGSQIADARKTVK